jgi:hypothetical protein
MKTIERKIMKIVLGVTILICSCLTNHAFAETRLDVGYRQDELNWSFFGGDNVVFPVYESELAWTDLQILEVKATIEKPIGKNLFAQGYVGYGWILHGKNRDSDWWGNNRTDGFSRSNNKSDHGHVTDASLGIGYYLHKKPRQSTALVAGYACNTQNLVTTDGNLELYFDPAVPLGPFEGLHNTFYARWRGPWAGVNFKRTVNDKLNMFARFEYHWADYYGEGNWNLRPELAHPKSMSHEADAKGTILAVGTEYKMNSTWKLKLLYEMSDFSTGRGTITQYAATGETASGPLNKVNWDSHMISLWAECKF